MTNEEIAKDLLNHTCQLTCGITCSLEKRITEALRQKEVNTLQDVVDMAVSFSRNGMNLGDLHEHLVRRIADEPLKPTDKEQPKK